MARSGRPQDLRGLIEQRFNTLQEQIRDLQRPSGTQVAATAAQLAAMQDASNASFSFGITGFSGWYPTSPASVIIDSITPRIEIGFGGALNGGDGYFCYSVVNSQTGSVVVARASVLTNPAERVAVSGGASFAPSGWKTTVVDVPSGVPLTVSLELNTGSTFTYFFGGSILVRRLPGTIQLPTI